MMRILTAFGCLAAFVLIAASATMNYLFSFSLGRTSLEGQVFGVVSVAVDVLKALLAVFVAKAVREGQRTFAVIGGVAFLLFATGSFVAAIGFTSVNRGAVTEGRQTGTQMLADIERDIATSRAKRDALPLHRPVPVVEAVIAGLRLDPRWSAAEACAAPRAAAHRELCLQASVATIELAIAVEASRLDGAITVLRERMSELRRSGNGAMADPQARFLAQSFGIDEATMQRALMSLIALIVELSSALGIYLATGHRAACDTGTVLRVEPVTSDENIRSTVEANKAAANVETLPVNLPAPDMRSSRVQARIGITNRRRGIANDSGGKTET